MRDYQLFTISLFFCAIACYLLLQTRRIAKSFKRKDEEQDYSRVILLGLFVLLGIIFIPWVFTSTIFNGYGKSNEIGDTIGGITAPFINGLSVVLVYMALRAQVDANKLIQDQIVKQEKSDRRRDFESSFFQLIKIHNQNVNNMDIKLNSLFDNQKSENGKRWFKIIERMRNEEKIELRTRDYNEPIIGKDVFKETYLLFDYMLTDILKTENKASSDYNRMKDLYVFIYEKLDADYGHYFRGLYRIFKVLDESEPFSDDEIENYRIKYHYSSIVRSQLSDYEIYWLFYNGIYYYGLKKFKPLIEKYGLLKILKYNEHPNLVKFKSLYAPTAFEKPSLLIS